MIPRINIKQKDEAVSTIVSAILAIMIVLLTVGPVIAWAVPYINEIQANEILENTEMQFNEIFDKIEDITKDESGGQKILSFTADKGYLILDKQICDRTIIMYSSLNTLNFTVRNLDKIDNQFIFVRIAGDEYPGRASVKRFLNNGKEEILDAVVFQLPDDTWLIKLREGKQKIEGTVEVVLYSHDDDDLIIGNVWIFDSNSLIYSLPSSKGNHQFLLEKNAIIYSEAGTFQIKRGLSLSTSENNIAIRIVQTSTSQSFSAGSSNLNIKLKLNSQYGLAIREKNYVYNLRLQLWGENSEFWLNYLSDKYSFDIENVFPNTLIYEESLNSPVWLNLFQALVEINTN